MSVTWNPSDKGPYTVLSNGNLTSTNSDASSNPSGVRATLSHSSGKYYLEYASIAGAVFHDVFGLATASQSLTAQAGAGMTTGFGVGDDGNAINSGATSPVLGNASGHNIGIAIDIDSGLWWFRYDGSSGWAGRNTTTADPVAETDGIDFTIATPAGSTLFPFVTQSYGGSTPMALTLLPGLATQVYTPPTGYAPWDGVAPPNLKRSFATVMS